ncbi:MAG: hypothetical protein EOL89_05000 [Actinobacteria bacterium]|nr:hypothetical protein [Actinomycetota bacterium]
MFRRMSGRNPVATHLKNVGALTTAPLEDGRWLAVAAGEFAVVDEDGISVRAPWTDLERASWDGERRELTMLRIDGEPPIVLRLATDEVFHTMTAVRERVNGSIVHVEYLATAGGEIRALVRRSADGTLFSQLVARGPVTDADMEAAASLERRARAAAGLPTT